MVSNIVFIQASPNYCLVIYFIRLPYKAAFLQARNLGAVVHLWKYRTCLIPESDVSLFLTVYMR
jgi:hypothetical protein